MEAQTWKSETESCNVPPSDKSTDQSCTEDPDPLVLLNFWKSKMSFCALVDQALTRFLELGVNICSENQLLGSTVLTIIGIHLSLTRFLELGVNICSENQQLGGTVLTIIGIHLSLTRFL
jgi:hypothetical protein